MKKLLILLLFLSFGFSACINLNSSQLGNTTLTHQGIECFNFTDINLTLYNPPTPANVSLNSNESIQLNNLNISCASAPICEVCETCQPLVTCENQPLKNKTIGFGECTEDRNLTVCSLEFPKISENITISSGSTYEKNQYELKISCESEEIECSPPPKAIIELSGGESRTLEENNVEISCSICSANTLALPDSLIGRPNVKSGWIDTDAINLFCSSDELLNFNLEGCLNRLNQSHQLEKTQIIENYTIFETKFNSCSNSLDTSQEELHLCELEQETTRQAGITTAYPIIMIILFLFGVYYFYSHLRSPDKKKGNYDFMKIKKDLFKEKKENWKEKLEV